MTEEFIKWIFEVGGPFGLFCLAIYMMYRQERSDRKEAERRTDEARANHMSDLQAHSAQLMENTMTLKAALEALKK